ncbi:thiol peroxidase, atypical 2-Cys peroxiredoxin [Dysgonomonas alginatilytica]|uniref:Thiol peroxidase n=1 Tax=Dysgonomonas alginatilytica TaxID=1605892 RepID=A0A2V3PVF9_9BACT|nr:thiol peroxidase [Dysgonomonas alginatilytica]PXV63780.1 thiol peroxidase, atypical 2-Cys peroxiredoxin [Dysgonomonas alginatilytica]
MAKISFKGGEVNTIGNLPGKGTQAPNFTLVNGQLAEVSLSDYKGKTVVLNIFPSLDTSVCAASVRKFNQEAAKLNNTVVLAVSADLPFAAGRFCTAEGIDNVTPVSVFRSPEFGKDYGVLMTDGPLKGLLARAVVVIDPKGNISYIELVPEITQEPNYQTAINSIV